MAVDFSTFLDENNLLNNRQFGFRQRRLTSNLMLLLSSEWKKAFEKGETTDVFAVDMAGAFDRVWHKGLAAKIQTLALNETSYTSLSIKLACI